MEPKRVTFYRDPSYPDRLSLAASALRDHQPRGWLRPAMAAAVAAALGASLTGCPRKPPATTGPTTEQSGGSVSTGSTVSPGATVAPGDTSYPPLPGIPVPPTPPSEEQVAPSPEPKK